MPASLRALVRPLLALLLASAAWPDSVRAQATGTDYVTFWQGDLRVFATQADTRVRLINIDTGVELGVSPIDLANAYDSIELTNNSVQHVRVESSPITGAGDRPIVVWTGALAAALKHPAAPPATPLNANAWMSYIPAIAAAGASVGTELGREFVGFTTREVYLFARKGANPTSITVQDLVTNVEADSDDTQVVTRLSGSLICEDAVTEIYHLDGFEDDTIRVTSNVDLSVMVGYGSAAAADWTVTPPSIAGGDDGSELGTVFYTFAHRDLSVFPTQDGTTVQITDLSDGDDTRSVFLANGDPAGLNYDFFTQVTTATSGGGMLTPRNDAVAIVTPVTSQPNAFDDDCVRISADKPVLVYVGPSSSNVLEFADVAFSVPTGPASRVIFAYAQNGGANDLQLFAYDSATNVQITSLTRTVPFGASTHHDFTIPAGTPYTGGNAFTNDWYFSSGVWNGEVLRITSDAPITVINGDYDQPNFGAFIPFVRRTPELPPIAVATAAPQPACPVAAITLDGTASFDQDGIPGALTPSWAWDFDIAVDSDGNLVPDDDVDAVGASVTTSTPLPGSFTARLTFTDDEGESDTDDVTVVVSDVEAPVFAACPADTTIACTAPLPMDAPVASDNCGPPEVTPSETTSPCSAGVAMTVRTWTARDVAGNTATCVQRITVIDDTPPTITGVPADLTIECADPVPPVARRCPEGTLARRIAGCVTADNYHAVYTGDADGQGLVDRDVGCVWPEGIALDFTTTSCFIYIAAWSEDVAAQGLVHDLTIDGRAAWSQDPGWQVHATGRDSDVCTRPTHAILTTEIQRANADNLWHAPSVGGLNDGTTYPWIHVECIAPDARWTWHDSGNQVSPGAPFNFGFDHDEFLIFRYAVRQIEVIDDCDPAPSLTTEETETVGACAGERTIVRTWTATDACGNQTNATQVIEVVDRTPPIVACPAPVAVQCAADVPGADTTSVVASDSCSDVVVTHVGDVSDGLACPETITRTYRATDACGNSTDCTQLIVVDDTTPPVVTCPLAVGVQCLEDVPAADVALVLATDNCAAGAVVTHVGDVSDGLACPETITRTYRATDACGNSTDCTQVIVVNDTTPPVVVTCPVAVGVQCLEDVPAADVTLVVATDNCAAGAVVTHVGDVSDGLACPETITRTYRATDACGNVTDCTQVIVVNDTTPPVATCPVAVGVQCREGVPLADVSLVVATDNCAAGAVVVHVGDVSDGLACPETITRTYRATDACGNATDCTQAIVVNDTTPPVVTCPAAVGVQCAPDVPAADVTLVIATDNCAAGAVVTHVGDVSDGLACPETITRTYRATDACGNSTDCTQAIVVSDTMAPVPAALLAPLPPLPPASPVSAAAPRSACSAPASAGFQVVCGATDNCDPSPDLAARLSVTSHDVVGGRCVRRVDEIPVACGEQVELRLVQAPCPARGARSARPAFSVNSLGIKVVTGESIVLLVTATDDCGNAATAAHDPTTPPAPPCETPLADGTCCPAIAAPAPPRDCRSAPCGG